MTSGHFFGIALGVITVILFERYRDKKWREEQRCLDARLDLFSKTLDLVWEDRMRTPNARTIERRKWRSKL